MPESRCLQGIWSSPWIFIFAAAGSAVGLGNIWKFPYILGENGAAFLLIYCICLLVVGLPMMVAEVALGRTVRSNPVDTVNDLSERHLIHRGWVAVPFIAGTTGLLILTFYSVIAGWTLAYAQRAATGAMSHIDMAQSQALFDDFLNSPVEMILWHTLFIGLVVLSVGQAVTRGLSKLVRILLPALVVTLIGLAMYSLWIGDAGQSLRFMVRWDWSELNFGVALSAIGHALFSLGIGLGAMFSYGAYMSKRMSIAKACSIVVGLDVLVSILAALAIFPLTFKFGLDVASGPGLPFISLPLIFSLLPGGQLLGLAFFALLVVAALTSAIAMMELFVAWLHERFYIGRLKAAFLLGVGVWAVGILVVLSFADWDAKLVFGYNLFELIDKLTSLVLLPVAAISLSILVAWVVPEKMLINEMIVKNAKHFRWWYTTLKYVSIPVAIFITLAGWIGV
ncbi:sodium-dependent transporter [Marinomonas piezotolerans]|uniref:Sodium-dependent transporter n=1 Tax=Marinomonas piezotolerans TaxID=2213058 RepID=A0A370U4P1_9GAMM|nr:sodium-dependent transporter [Marinomonas piezotolerans]RDL42750.1 sodium-dependent transporter [Marinomonas piezotolerans]